MIDSYESWADQQLLIEHELYPERFTRVEWLQRKVDPQDAAFAKLVAIVADVFGVRPLSIMSNPRGGLASEARHVVAALWTDRHTLKDTAKRMGITHFAIHRSRKRAQQLATRNPRFSEQVAKVVTRLKIESPDTINY
jgi:hypothetical protein